MEILVFIVVIVALIVVHEFGHFLAAKLSGMRVEEFGIGYPPRALMLGKRGETVYTLNWLPFGGFVKIHGEDGDAHDARAFSAKPRLTQAFVLVAGIAMNLVFAYLLIIGALVAGTPRALSPGELARAKDVELAVSRVLPGSPAARAGLIEGDAILSAQDARGSWRAGDPESFSAFVAASGGAQITLEVKKAGGGEGALALRAAPGVVSGEADRYALGVGVAAVGVVPLPLGRALIEGARLTLDTTMFIARGLAHFFIGIFTFSADLSQVAGPVGIAGAVAAASAAGAGDLLSLMAVISINLALINLIPVPALDGGRLLFVALEGATRRRIKPAVARAVNAAGFALLILLMAVVTAHDLFKLVG